MMESDELKTRGELHTLSSPPAPQNLKISNITSGLSEFLNTTERKGQKLKPFFSEKNGEVTIEATFEK
jgi:hypothetical protein